MTIHEINASESLSREEEALIGKSARVIGERKKAGLEGLVGGLDSVIIAVEADRLEPAVSELLRYTGLRCT
jgi:hypothetical protein